MSSALIVIDVQESFLQQPLWAASSNPGIAGRVGRLVSAARPRGDVATAHGPGAAARVAREMVVYARRNGSEPQASAMLRYRSHLSDTVHRAQDLIDARFTERLPLAQLAASSGVSQRTLTRLFGQATGMTPLRYQQLLRAEHAEHVIGHGATVASAARAAGFEDARMLRRLRTDSAVRRERRAAGRAGSATATG